MIGARIVGSNSPFRIPSEIVAMTSGIASSVNAVKSVTRVCTSRLLFNNPMFLDEAARRATQAGACHRLDHRRTPKHMIPHRRAPNMSDGQRASRKGSTRV
jgi:hypothetical protein